jgi:hypothetical protein
MELPLENLRKQDNYMTKIFQVVPNLFWQMKIYSNGFSAVERGNLTSAGKNLDFVQL